MIRSHLYLIFIVLAALSFLYAVPIFFVQSGTLSFLLWIFAGFGFLGLAFVFYNEHYLLIPPVLRYILLFLLLFSVLIFSVVEALIISGFRKDAPKDLDYLIVLGSQMRANGPALVYKYRLDTAADYLEENPETLCVLTGGKGANEPVTESEGGLQYLFEKHLDPKRFLLDKKSVDTPQNIAYAFQLIEEDHQKKPSPVKVGIVTNQFHCYRGRMLAKKAAENTPTPIEIYTLPAPLNPLYLPSNMLREFFGVTRDVVFGKMDLVSFSPKKHSQE